MTKEFNSFFLGRVLILTIGNKIALFGCDFGGFLRKMLRLAQLVLRFFKKNSLVSFKKCLFSCAKSKSKHALTYFLLIQSFLLSVALAGERPVWPCPVFGECHFRIIFGPCQAYLGFEYSNRMYSKNTSPAFAAPVFWGPSFAQFIDQPKPCEISLRVGDQLYRETLEHYACQEVVTLFQDLAHSGKAVSVAKAQDIQELCQRSEMRGDAAANVNDGFNDGFIDASGVSVMVHPTLQFRDGFWRPLKRESTRIAGLNECYVKIRDLEERIIICPDLKEPERSPIEVILAKVHFRVRGQPLKRGKAKFEAAPLAPGDRMHHKFD